ncbi:dihydropteroate synthase [Verrucomicrobia bacterium]|nr:dihydropteroate synthase [Verrucomicrobiota bacterium]
MLTLDWLADLHATHRNAFQAKVNEFDIGGRDFHFDRHPCIMGVINLSKDSWYRESVCFNTDQALRRADLLLAQGADVIDLGAESTLAQASLVGVESQWKSLEPIVEKIVDNGGIVSLETYHLDLVKRALESGVQVINLTGHTNSKDVYRLCAQHQAAVIICYVQGANVRSVESLEFGSDPILEMGDWFKVEIDRAVEAGVKRIFLDPGLGFYYRNMEDGASRVKHQMKTFLNTFRLRELGWPVCHALPHSFETFGEEVRTAESFFAILALLGKTDLLRTHEVSKVKAVIDTLQQF